MNVDGLQADIDAMRACLRSRKGPQLSKKQRKVFLRWLNRSEAALDRATTGDVDGVLDQGRPDAAAVD